MMFYKPFRFIASVILTTQFSVTSSNFYLKFYDSLCVQTAPSRTPDDFYETKVLYFQFLTKKEIIFDLIVYGVLPNNLIRSIVVDDDVFCNVFNQSTMNFRGRMPKLYFFLGHVVSCNYDCHPTSYHTFVIGC